MRENSKSTGKRLRYELEKKYSKFKLYRVYDKDRFLYRTTKEK